MFLKFLKIVLVPLNRRFSVAHLTQASTSLDTVVARSDMLFECVHGSPMRRGPRPNRFTDSKFRARAL